MYEYNMTYPNELYHYGVKGMKWGKRKTRRWAEAKHQPSSFKSSVLAGAYAATGNKRIAKALDKSNDRDAERWERAKATDPKNYAKQPMSTKKKVAIGAAAVVGTALAAYGAHKVSGILKEKAFRQAYEKGEKTAIDYLSRYNRIKVYPGNDRQLANAISKSNQLNREFSQQNLRYANRASKNTLAAIKTLSGKNRELTPAELRRMGIKTF